MCPIESRPAILSSWRLALTLSLLAATVPSAAVAQTSPSCNIAVHAGLSFVSPPELPDPQAALRTTVTSGAAMGAGFKCPVAGALRVGFGLEREHLHDLGINHALGSVGVDLPEVWLGSATIRTGVDARFGWVWAGERVDRVVAVVCPPGGDCGVRELGGSGAAGGLDVWLDLPLDPPFTMFLRGGWRVKELDILGQPEEERPVPGLVPVRDLTMHTFPVIVGLSLSL